MQEAIWDERKNTPKPHCPIREGQCYKSTLIFLIHAFKFSYPTCGILQQVLSVPKKAMFKDTAFIWILSQMVFTKSLTDFDVWDVNTEKTAEYPADVFTLSYP